MQNGGAKVEKPWLQNKTRLKSELGLKIENYIWDYLSKNIT